MANMQFNAEIYFYDEISKTNLLEIGEMSKNNLEDGSIEISINRSQRLLDALDAFQIELDYNLVQFKTHEKISIIDRHLKKASKRKTEWAKEYEEYLIKDPSMYWVKPNTHQNIVFMFKLINKLETVKNELSGPKLVTKIAAPVIGLFCSFMNDGQLIPKSHKESSASYCIRICGKFNLDYRDRVRQNFEGHIGKNNMNLENTKKVQLQILPIIDTVLRDKVSEYIDNKLSTTKNLYA